ncbi:MAG: hypothetical protein MOB07_31080 [Acidobacteria bacterium]|nr:hypothetical protein [Acidobacteriota bacterium]
MNRLYVATIGERFIRVEARNVWEAGYNAAIKFGSYLLEGSQFFEGKKPMDLYRLTFDQQGQSSVNNKPVFSGFVHDWLRVFTNQERVMRNPAWKRAAQTNQEAT